MQPSAPESRSAAADAARYAEEQNNKGDSVIRGLRARRSAEQGRLGDRRLLVSNPKGGDVMVETVHSKPGLTTALVAIGWLSFVVGALTQSPLLSIPLLAIARVLP